ncbi:MAG: peptidylprolyl isomerase [Blastocatellia bacterium]
MAANRTAVIETNKGTIKFELAEDLAPVTTANFINLAENNFYDGLTFHRVEPGFCDSKLRLPTRQWHGRLG